MPLSDDTATPAASTTDTPTPHEPKLRHAYTTLLPTIQALQPEEMEQLNLELYSTMIKVVGAWPRIQTMREPIQKHLPTFDLKSFDEIEERAMAMGYAHTRYLSSQTPPEAMPALNEKAVKWRDLLLHVCKVLVQWKLINQTEIDAYKGASGYRPVSAELGGLIGLLRMHWQTVSARSGVLPEELDEAEFLVDQMVSAQGVRNQGATDNEATRLRQSAFTLFIRAYNEASFAIHYLRRKEGDADTIIPPLYSGRRTSPRADSSEPADPATPPVTGTTTTSPASPATPAPHPATTPAAPPTPLPPMGPSTPGGPGGSPFIS